MSFTLLDVMVAKQINLLDTCILYVLNNNIPQIIGGVMFLRNVYGGSSVLHGGLGTVHWGSHPSSAAPRETARILVPFFSYGTG